MQNYSALRGADGQALSTLSWHSSVFHKVNLIGGMFQKTGSKPSVKPMVGLCSRPKVDIKNKTKMSYIQQAIREWVWIVGAERLDQQWLLTDYDTWEPNPHYHGPDQGHPEDYYDYAA